MKLLLIFKLALGGMALLLGLIGVFLPIWPTTPFVLLALWCFSSTPKIRERILRISFVREYYEGYTVGQGIKRKTVVTSLTFLWLMLIISVLWTQKLLLAIILTCIGIGVTTHILWIATPKEKRKLPLRRANDEQ